MIRAFLGVALPEEVRSALIVQQFLLPLPRKVDPELLHLTLVFLGDCPPPMLEAAHEAFHGVKDGRFALSLQGLGLFGGDRPKVAWAGVAPSDPLVRLQSRVEHLARRAGCPITARKFVPHVTLGRFPPPPPAIAARLEHTVALGAGFQAGPWEVTELVLWQSHLGPKGARYDVLARYPLS
jgi:RNA 2',3'-cyclic 3'-phosphodiesterase